MDRSSEDTKTGRVFGMMPHPEAFLSIYNHPAWTSLKRRGIKDDRGDGLKIFTNIVEHIKMDSKGAS